MTLGYWLLWGIAAWVAIVWGMAEAFIAVATP